MRQALIGFGGVLAGFALAGVLFLLVRAPLGRPIELERRPTESPIAVHVVGAVPRPGLYEFAAGARVQDAIDAAGGLLAGANADGLNLAALLQDGEQLSVPYVDGAPAGGSGVQPPAGSPAPVNQTPTSGDLVNINTASREELDLLPGIGPTVAQQIVDYRTANGPFARIEELLNVPGIGPSTFEALRSRITV